MKCVRARAKFNCLCMCLRCRACVCVCVRVLYTDATIKASFTCGSGGSYRQALIKH